MSHCAICDYSPEEGSDYADLPPGIFKLHPTIHGDFLCDECLNQYEDNLADLEANDEDDT